MAKSNGSVCDECFAFGPGMGCDANCYAKRRANPATGWIERPRNQADVVGAFLADVAKVGGK